MRINDRKIFDVYVESLITEAKKSKKNLPPWLKEKKGEKKEEKDSDEKKDKKSAKGKKLPPWLKKKGKKIVKEHHESFSPELLEIPVSALLDELQSADPELYSKLEQFLATKDTDDSIEVDADIDAKAEIDPTQSDISPATQESEGSIP